MAPQSQQPLDYASMRAKNGALIVHFFNGDPFEWPKTHRHYDEVVALLKAKAPGDELRKLMDEVGVMKQAFSGIDIAGIEVGREGITYGGEQLPMTLATRIVEAHEEGFDIAPMSRFLVNLLGNPHRSAVLSLYDFLERNKTPLTEDGCFVVYKMVRDDYMDCYTGKFDNSPGKTVEMMSWQVDADRENGCSHGLHVCSRDYLGKYRGERVVMVKVNPAHVVAVPTDYNFAKMRVYKYVVIGELTDEQAAERFDSQFVAAPIPGVTFHGHDYAKNPERDYFGELPHHDEGDEPTCDSCDEPISECQCE